MAFRMSRGYVVPDQALRTPAPSPSRSIPAAAPSGRARKASAIRGPTLPRAARISGGWPSSARLAGPISSARLHRRVQSAADGDIERERTASIAMSSKPAPLRMRRHALFGREGERAGIFGPCLRQLRHMSVDRLQRRHHPRIFACGSRQQANDERGPTAATRGADWRRTARDRRRTSRRSARPADRSSRDRTDRPSHRPARNRPADPSARARAPAPASARRFDAEHEPSGATCPASAIDGAPQPQPTSRMRSPGFRRRSRSIRICDDRRQQTSCAACRSVQRWPSAVPVGDLVGVLSCPGGASMGVRCSVSCLRAHMHAVDLSSSKHGSVNPLSKLIRMMRTISAGN